MARIGFSLILFIFLIGFANLAGSTENSPHLNKALDYSRLGKWNLAVTEFQKVLEGDPENGLIRANLGVALSRLNRHKEALLSFEKALKTGYDTAEFRYIRGLSFAKVELLEEAAHEIETALDKDPHLKFADYDLGLVYNRMGLRSKALRQVTALYKRNNKLARKLFFQIRSKYKIGAVDHGGSLGGSVRLMGKVPKARSFHLVHAPNIEFCSRISDGQGHRILYDFEVSNAGALKDTVIAIQGVSKGKSFPRQMQKVVLNRCQASKYVIGYKNGEDILLENTDPIKHEIAVYEVNGVYKFQTTNKSVVAHRTQVRSTFMKPNSHEMILKCNLHPFLQTRGFMVENPYYAVSDEEGRFLIEDIPAGTYEVWAWHPFVPTQKGTITIEPGKEAEINFTFQGEDERRKLYHDDTKGYRFNTWFDSKENFYGGTRVDDPVEVLQKFDNSDRYISGLPSE